MSTDTIVLNTEARQRIFKRAIFAAACGDQVEIRTANDDIRYVELCTFIGRRFQTSDLLFDIANQIVHFGEGRIKVVRS